MRLFKSKKAAALAEAQRHLAAMTERAEAAFAVKQKAAAAHRATHVDQVKRLSTRYYVASALVANGMADPGYQIGIMAGLTQALSEVTGIDEIIVSHRMHNGIPVTSSDWICVNKAPVGAPGNLELRHEGICEPWAERLDMLHRDALKATGHPMYQILYGKVPA